MLRAEAPLPLAVSTTTHGLPPGPRWPKLAQAVAFGRDPAGFLERCAAKYGEPFTVRMPNDAPRVIVSDPVRTAMSA